MSCPCGLGSDYTSCCEPLHKLEKFAETAEQLMRSRYCAFVKHEIDYIVGSQDEVGRKDLNKNEIEAWSKESEWKKLDIVEVVDGESKDETGTVEFKATYQVGNKEVVHHEKASFKREDSKWVFEEGEVLRDSVKRAGPKIGRNDPCPCGSGKKYKKCCLINA
jgi:SEC-C motif-containing protein